MNIHEYQAKEILKVFNVPVPEGIVATTSDEVAKAAEKLGGKTCVVKAQIHAGGRGKAGGVKVVHNPEEAEKAASIMLGSPLITKQTGDKGQIVSKVYVEQGVDIADEFYLSLVVDRGDCRVAVVVSEEGGMDIEDVAEKSPEKIISYSVDPVTENYPYLGRVVANRLGLKGLAAKECVFLIQNLYKAFIAKDMSQLEINPLIVTKKGHLICLDAKVSFDDNSLIRHPELAEMRDLKEENKNEIEASEYGLSYVSLDGNIGCMVNGAGLAMATMDIIKAYGAEPANFLDVGGGATVDKVCAAFKIITSDSNVKGILVNIFGGIMKCDVIAEGILQALKQINLSIPLVVRLEGTNVEKGKAVLAASGLNVLSAVDLDDAAKKIVAAVA